MQPKPLYVPGSAEPCYRLWYGWAGWPTSGSCFPAEMESLLSAPADAWEADGLRLLEHSFCPDRLLMTFSVTPQVAPAFFTARVKGRLQYAMRQAGQDVTFSRKVGMRSIGENHRAEVEGYIERQVERDCSLNAAAKAALRPFTVVDPSVDLASPTATHSGRYWYNLHVVLVTAERWRNTDPRWLAKIRDQSQRIAVKKGYGLSRLSVMPEHVHLAIRGTIDHSPEEIALAFQNNLAYALRQVYVWQPTYYVGTFGEYDMTAVRSWDDPAQ